MVLPKPMFEIGPNTTDVENCAKRMSIKRGDTNNDRISVNVEEHV